MAKALRESIPSSSVARLLDKSAATRALEPMESMGQVDADRQERDHPEPSCTPTPARQIKREFILSPEADDAFSRLLDIFRRSTQTRLSASYMLRALILAAGHALPTLEREARRLGRLRLPGNGPGTEALRESFERRLAAAFVAGMRATDSYELSADETARSRDRTGR